MNSESKTTEDILREMREYADQLDNDGDITGADFRDFANQLEEAMKREKVEAVTLAAGQAVNLTNEKWRRDMGNTAAMRAALERILDIEGYGAPMIEAKCVAQKALEGQQCTPPIAQERPQIEQPGDAVAMRDTHGVTGDGWYGFDLDGTLARYDGWKGIDHIGEPISAMVDLIKRLHAEGKIVKIMTARVAPRNDTIDGHDARYYVCEWCAKHLGFTPDVVFQKDARMIQLYDDRVKQVVPNTGILVENLAGCGNAAALRKALEAMLDEYCDLCDVPNQMTDSGHTCSWRNRWSGCQSKAIDKALAALAAPPRNCDRYPNAALALGAYHDGPPVGEEWDDADWMMFLDWLFATEKGGTK